MTGERVKKKDELVEALGNNDELSSNIGVAMEFCRQHQELESLVGQLVNIQCRIQELNSSVASRGSRPFDESGVHTKTLEEWIDAMDTQLPLLKSFILPV